ncbi:hypothetical protein BG58_14070 [Caballeronia jiangsuensis]|nr:hypothetical protein BG58_14070 [Caballeronia jiangsuensis]
MQVFFERVGTAVGGEFVGWLRFFGAQARQPAMADYKRHLTVERGERGGCCGGWRRGRSAVAVTGRERK